MLRVAVVAAMLALASCAGLGAPANDASVEAAVDLAALTDDGRAIAEAQCAGCHAIGEYGDSPNAAAPVFRTILSNYRADVLEEELIQGIQVAHPMPDFQFNAQGADALIAYLQSIQAE